MLQVLSGYSLAIVEEATRPETGLQRKCVFPPRIAEIVAFCDGLAAHNSRIERLRNWSQPQIEPPQEPRPSMAQLTAKFAGELLPPGYGRDAARGFVTGQAPSFAELIPAYKANPERLQGLISAPGTRRSTPER